MKKVLCFLCFSILSITLVGCNQKSLKLKQKSNYEISNNDVIMTIDKGTVTNTGAKIQISNYTGQNYEYGAEFFIEYQKNGTWYMIIPKNEMNFNMMSYLLVNDEIKEYNLNWESSYGKLPSGKYRIVKSFSLEKDQSKDDIYVSAEFTIE